MFVFVCWLLLQIKLSPWNWQHNLYMNWLCPKYGIRLHIFWTSLIPYPHKELLVPNWYQDVSPQFFIKNRYRNWIELLGGLEYISYCFVFYTLWIRLLELVCWPSTYALIYFDSQQTRLKIRYEQCQRSTFWLYGPLPTGLPHPFLEGSSTGN